MMRIMKGMRAFVPFAIGAALAAGGLFLPQMAFAIGVPKLQADNSTYAAIWYLGPGISNVTGYGGNVYNTTITANATAPPGDDNPHPVITYQTNEPSIISLTPNGASVLITAIGPSYTTAQSQPVYNVTITATWDGEQSPPVYLLVNIPYSNTVVNEGQYCSSPGVCNCNAGFKPGQTGYVTLLDVYVRDLFGNALVQIPANETLKDPLYLGTGGWTSSLGVPTQGKWPLNLWNSEYSFPDYYWICSPNPGSLTPPLTNYGTSGVIAVFTETQNYWIGSTTNGSGVCTQVDYSQLYTDHGVQGGAEIPGYPATTLCGPSYFINPIPPL